MDGFEQDAIKNKAVRGATQTASGKTKQQIKHTKKTSMIKAFIYAGERGLNCFEAVKLHDYILRTTVSDLQKSCGLKFSRKWETVPNAFGNLTDCVRYWLDDENIKIANALIGRDNESEVMQ